MKNDRLINDLTFRRGKLRKQLTYLRSFVESFDFIKMQPDFKVVYHSPGSQWQAISEPGKQYAIIFCGIAPDWIKLNLPIGNYHYEFISPFSGKILKKGILTNSKENITQLNVPRFDHLVALKIIN